MLHCLNLYIPTEHLLKVSVSDWARFKKNDKKQRKKKSRNVRNEVGLFPSYCTFIPADRQNKRKVKGTCESGFFQRHLSGLRRKIHIYCCSKGYKRDWEALDFIVVDYDVFTKPVVALNSERDEKMECLTMCSNIIATEQKRTPTGGSTARNDTGAHNTCSYMRELENRYIC